MHYTVEGDDSLGYKITVESPGAAGHDVYVIRDGSSYKAAASPWPIRLHRGPFFLALRELEKKNI